MPKNFFFFFILSPERREYSYYITCKREREKADDRVLQKNGNDDLEPGAKMININAANIDRLYLTREASSLSPSNILVKSKTVYIVLRSPRVRPIKPTPFATIYIYKSC